MTKLLDFSIDRVILGDGKFDTNNNYLYQDNSFTSDLDVQIFTSTLSATNLRVLQEQEFYLNYSFEPDASTDSRSKGRVNFGPALPTSGPFLLFYSIDGTGDLTRFANLLLIDKPPVKTGFYNFSIDKFTFTGLIRQISKYDHWNWELIAQNRYGYRKQSRPLGYGIEISINQLYDREAYTENGNKFFRVIEKPLKQFLMSLQGNEEITSSPATLSPSTYNVPVEGVPTSIPNIRNSNTVFYDFTRGYDLFNISREEALYYIASYPDLIASIGPNPSLGQNHYNNIGLPQGRKITFNPILYINSYPDIKQRYNYDTYGATIHYITVGFPEGRFVPITESTFVGRGGLYDERIGSVNLNEKNIIWPNGKTINAAGKRLSYEFDKNSFNVNGRIDVQSNKVYMRTY